jgi:hypothetical protein
MNFEFHYQWYQIYTVMLTDVSWFAFLYLITEGQKNA